MERRSPGNSGEDAGLSPGGIVLADTHRWYGCHRRHHRESDEAARALSGTKRLPTLRRPSRRPPQSDAWFRVLLPERDWCRLTAIGYCVGMSNRKVNGSVVAVTGARGGVGRAVVREFAKRRGSIALLARGEAGLAAAAAEVTAAAALGAGLTAALGRKARRS